VPDDQIGTVVAPTVAPPSDVPAVVPDPAVAPAGPVMTPPTETHDDWLRQDAPVP
jgi:hypothetical protein